MFYALLLMLFFEREGLILRMGRRRIWVFIFSGLGEILVSCLHTLLRDQTPCSSLPKRFLWVSSFFNFENSFEEEMRGLKGTRLEKQVRLVQLLSKKVKVGI